MEWSKPGITAHICNAKTCTDPPVPSKFTAALKQALFTLQCALRYQLLMYSVSQCPGESPLHRQWYKAITSSPSAQLVTSQKLPSLSKSTSVCHNVKAAWFFNILIIRQVKSFAAKYNIQCVSLNSLSVFWLPLQILLICLPLLWLSQCPAVSDVHVHAVSPPPGVLSRLVLSSL